jgi:tetratricopeptide (TPR) repeat protein
VDVSPTSLTAVNRLADALLQRDYTAEGIRLHEQILRSNPSFWQSHFQLGNAYFKVGRFPEAEEHLLAASRLQPSTPQIYIYLAIAQIRNQHYNAAEQSARAAVALWPNTPGGFYVLGTALAQQGHWPEAAAAFERELANDPDQPKVRDDLEAARRHIQ